jgi:hypothetical protein
MLPQWIYFVFFVGLIIAMVVLACRYTGRSDER